MKQILIATVMICAGACAVAQVTHPQSTTGRSATRSATQITDTMSNRKDNKARHSARTKKRSNTRTADTARYRDNTRNSRYNGNNR